MRTRTLDALALLAVAALLPFATDAAIPVPTASKTPACSSMDVPPSVPDGDEKFFNIPGGVPNVMLLLDSSGSMLDFPNDIPYPSAWPASGGTCSVAAWSGFVAKRTNTPYDNGFNTGITVDDPPWGLTRCTSGVAGSPAAAPAADNTTNNCLFRGDSYYKAVSQTGQWATATAKTFNANPCAAIQDGGAALNDRFGVRVVPTNAAECTSCLASAGYYLWRRSYTANNGSTQTTTQAVFTGAFLNANPPKHVIARKVVKDLTRIDPAAPNPIDQVRLGLTIFTDTSGASSSYSTGLRASDGGRLVVPLGPNCDDSVPPTQTNYAPTRQAIINAIDSGTTVPFTSSTPLAESLFNVGQYFAQSTLYTSLFGASWSRASFVENQAGSIAAPWVSVAGKRQASFCWSCQQASVVVVTDGEPNIDSNLPASTTPASNHSTFNNDFRKWSNPTVDCAACGNDLSGSPANAMHKVAYFLSQTDLRPELPNGARPQTLQTYTISFGIDPTLDPKAIAVLQKTADLGNGIFRNTSSGADLAAALNEAVNDVLQKSTSFSSANANSLQTSRTNQADAYVARFKPNDAAQWEGHVFAAMLFDEFGQGCDARFPTGGQKKVSCGTKVGVNPNLNADDDVDGKAICNSAYLVDKDCDPIIEDATGNYKKGTFTSGTLITTPDEANMFWDAGRVLSDPAQAGYRSAKEGQGNSRKLYTTIDVNGNGRLQSDDGIVDFVASNAAALAPSMALDQASCESLLTAAAICTPGATAPAGSPPACGAWGTTVQTKCAEVVINFYRGYDVLDWDGDRCAGPGGYYNTNPWGSCTTSTQCGSNATCVANKCVTSSCPAGEERDRVNDSRPTTSQQFWKLGDIFHSSPFLVRPPIDKLLCTLGGGQFVQCAETLFSPQTNSGVPTPLAAYGSLDAYDAWRQENIERQQFILVGANDGMLHAFDAGLPDKTKPKQFDGSYPYGPGTGSELWGYVPPDLLPKLKYGLRSHQYYVDGTTMVRDVWVDFNTDGKKQKEEFRTVAVITERAGGSRYTGLDVTDPATPRFLWTFPEGCTSDSLLAGQSWSEFLPRPPPIGAVRLEPKGADPTSRGYDERWIVMLNGGYDPAMVRGRVVWMLDVYTGQKIWQFGDAEFKAMRGDAKASMFPVAATVGMSDVGKLDVQVGPADTDDMFDTATWGDLGGNIWVARFHEVGKFGGSGLVSNWTAARTFEQQRQSDDTQRATGRTQIFHMTSNVPQYPRALRVLVGSGNRAALMNERPQCGPQDLFGCAQNGCTSVSSTAAVNYGGTACTTSTTFSSTAGVLSYADGATTGCGAAFVPTSPLTRGAQVSASCGTGGTLPASTASATYDANGLPTAEVAWSTSATFTPAVTNPCVPSRFYSFWAYGLNAAKRFTTTAEAKLFDDARFTDVDSSKCSGWPAASCKLVEVANAQVKLDTSGNFSPICMDGASKCKAEGTDPGWMFTYGKWCPEGPGKCSTTPPWCDERTGSQPGGAFNCVIWSGFRPTGAAASNDPCTASTGSPTSYTYFADYFTGIPTMAASGGRICGIANLPQNPTELKRGAQKNAFSAPQAAQLRVTVNSSGQVNYSALKVETGSSPEKINLGTRSSAAEPLYWLEVPKQVHTCRHVDAATCE